MAVMSSRGRRTAETTVVSHSITNVPTRYRGEAIRLGGPPANTRMRPDDVDPAPPTLPVRKASRALSATRAQSAMHWNSSHERGAGVGEHGGLLRGGRRRADPHRPGAALSRAGRKARGSARRYGQLADCEWHEWTSPRSKAFEEVLDDLLSRLSIPVLYGLRSATATAPRPLSESGPPWMPTRSRWMSTTRRFVRGTNQPQRYALRLEDTVGDRDDFGSQRVEV
jgi:hypothetical protein